MAFKNWKTQLRKDHYDIYDTDEERKNHRPKAVKKEDLNLFVDICSSVKEQEKRKKGKIARSKMVSPHTIGRMGSDRKKEILISVSESSIMSSCVKPLMQSDTTPVVLLHGFDRMEIYISVDCGGWDRNMGN
ncbi:hypothetical protein GIB67_009913 [Kingdonia uniflora]|uniref:Uncharacterized protein n=1 Tax=Kingdonia uniflora TaxID=39325 RepID=A0A7J7L4A3_9MAGN|nr:hypothetical protein GIB67_009913 [Kingdonia uniflora]